MNVLIPYIILVPLFFLPMVNLRVAQEAFFQASTASAIMALLFFFNRKPIKLNKVSVMFGIFVIYSYLLFTLSGFKQGSVYLYNIFISSLLYFCVLGMKKEDTKQFFNVIGWIAAFNILYIAVQALHLDFVWFMKGPGGVATTGIFDPIGFFGLKAHMGIFMAIAMMSLIRKNFLVSQLLWIPIYMSKSTGAMLAAGVACLFYLYWTRRKIFKIMIPLVLAGSFVYIIFVDAPMGMFGSRPPMWQESMRDVVYGYNLRTPDLQSPYLRNIFTGFGLDGFRTGVIKYFKLAKNDTTVKAIQLSDKLVDAKGRPYYAKEGKIFTPDNDVVDYWDNAHCEPVNLFYNFGLIGVIVIGFMFYFICSRFGLAIKTPEAVSLFAMMIVFVMSSLTHFPFHIPRLGFLVPLILGFFIINSEDEHASN